MNTKSVISGLMAVCMMASAPAFAQRYDHGNDGNNRSDQGQRGVDQNRHQQYQDRGQGGHHDGNEHGERQRRNDGYGHNDGYNRNDGYDRHNGYNRNDGYGRGDHRQGYRGHDAPRYHGYRHEMRRGAHLPNEYRGSRYVVNDWRGRHLSAPPRGYHWVQANNDYVLAAIATGLIAQVLLNN